MIVDTSAVVAILAGEPDAEVYIQAIAQSQERRMSAATFMELAMVVEGQFGTEAGQQCEALLRRAQIRIEPVTEQQAYLARQAFRDFGKGRHAAGLNFGDCFAYALAKDRGEALLFKGNDFKRTDVKAALSSAQ